MTRFRRWFSRLNGFALSLLLHGVVGGLAALSVFGVSGSSGGSWGSGGASSGGGRSVDVYRASMRQEVLISGESLGDPVQYGRLTEDVPEPEPVEIAPPLPFDARPEPSPVPAEPPSSRPAPASVRGVKLPPSTP